MSYSKISNEQLFRIYISGNTSVLNELVFRLFSHGKKYLVTFCKSQGIDYCCDDFELFILDIANRCIKKFDFSKVSLDSYFISLLKRDLINYINDVYYKKISVRVIESLDRVDKIKDFTLYEMIEDKTIISGTSAVNLSEFSKEFMFKGRRKKKHLKKQIMRIVSLSIDGYSCKEIAEKIGTSLGTVRNYMASEEYKEFINKITRHLI